MEMVVADLDLFAIYLEGLEEAKRGRESFEELIDDYRKRSEHFQALLKEWNTTGPHDPAEDLGMKEYSDSIQTPMHEFGLIRARINKETSRFEDEFLAASREMMAVGEYDLKLLLTRRLEETRRRNNEDLPKLLELVQKVADVWARWEVFLDQCSSKSTP